MSTSPTTIFASHDTYRKAKIFAPQGTTTLGEKKELLPSHSSSSSTLLSPPTFDIGEELHYIFNRSSTIEEARKELLEYFEAAEIGIQTTKDIEYSAITPLEDGSHIVVQRKNANGKPRDKWDEYQVTVKTRDNGWFMSNMVPYYDIQPIAVYGIIKMSHNTPYLPATPFAPLAPKSFEQRLERLVVFFREDFAAFPKAAKRIISRDRIKEHNNKLLQIIFGHRDKVPPVGKK